MFSPLLHFQFRFILILKVLFLRMIFLQTYISSAWTGYGSIARRFYLENRRHAFMSRMGFKPTLPVLERIKTTTTAVKLQIKLWPFSIITVLR
jgi:hypothetical protein